MNNRSIALSVLFAASSVVPAFAAHIELAFDRLPSEQGWLYEGDSPETDFFSLHNGILRMDARGQGGNQIARYSMYDFIDPLLPFTMKFRLRVINSDSADLREVFSVGAIGPDFGPRIGWERVRDAPTSQVAVQVETIPGIPEPIGTAVDTGFHDYQLTAKAGGLLTFWIDGALIAQGPTPVVGFVNVLFFGDAALADANGFVELQQFSFDQSSVPEPGSLSLVAIAAIASAGFLWRRSRRE